MLNFHENPFYSVPVPVYALNQPAVLIITYTQEDNYDTLTFTTYVPGTQF